MSINQDNFFNWIEIMKAMASLLFSLKVKESYTQTLPVTCFLVNVCLLLLSFFLLSADVWFPLNQSSSLKKTWILMTPISVKFHFLGLPLSKPRNSQRKKWRTFDSLSIVVVFFYLLKTNTGSWDMCHLRFRVTKHKNEFCFFLWSFLDSS